MQATSDAWNQAVTVSHHVVARAEVLDRGTVVDSDLLVETGQVTMDKTADSERQLSLDLVDKDGAYTPAGLEDMLAPNGNELRVWQGLAWPGPRDVIGEVCLGTFGITETDVDSEGTGNKVSITGYDRAKLVSLAGFDSLFYLDGSINKAQGIIDILLTRVPWLEILFDATVTDQLMGASSDTASGFTYMVGDDPWQKARDIATSMGKELYFDAMGRVALRDPVDPTTAPVAWTYTDGVDATILTLSKKYAADNSCSGVVAVSTSTMVDDPLSWYAWDDDPLSPTYYLGKFGKRLRKWESNQLNTVEQCQMAAMVVLSQYKGLLEDVQFTAIANPAHEAGDVVEVRLPEAKVVNKYVLQSVTIPVGIDDDLHATTKLARVLPSLAPVPVTVKGSATAVASGALAASVRVKRFGAAALAGSGALTARPGSHTPGSAALSGTGMLSDRGVLGRVGGAALGGVGGTLTAAGRARATGAAAITSDGYLVTASLVLALAAADRAGAGDMEATAA